MYFNTNLDREEAVAIRGRHIAWPVKKCIAGAVRRLSIIEVTGTRSKQP
jgi:hypothetical protein